MKELIIIILARIESILRFFLASRTNLSSRTKYTDKVSIILVVYNGLDYLKKTINSLQMTHYKNFEIVVVDNNSSEETKEHLDSLKKQKIIHKLVHLTENSYFSGGNNIGAKLADKNSKYLLLLNTDVEILDPLWLDKLLILISKKGIASYGYANVPFRPDGWCFLINKSLYINFGGIDEKYKMSWGITDLTGKVLAKDHEVKVIMNYKKLIKHFGERSYTSKLKKIQNENKISNFTLLTNYKWLKVKSIVWKQ